MGRILRRGAFAAVAVAALTVGATHTAVADDGKAYAVDRDASTSYWDRGDYITVCDLTSDYHGAVGWIEVRQSDGSFRAFSHVYNGYGYNSCSQVVQDVLRESSTIKVVSCLQDGSGGRPWNCGWKYISG